MDTGANGQLGRLVIEGLIKRIPASQVIASVRNVDGARDLAAIGVNVLAADYDDPASLAAAFEGVDRLLLISSSPVGRRIAQHGHVIDAAKQAGVSLIAYTSVLRADTSSLGWRWNIEPPKHGCAPAACRSCCCAMAGIPNRQRARRWSTG